MAVLKGIAGWLGVRFGKGTGSQADSSADGSSQPAASGPKAETASASPPAATTSAYAPVLKELREVAKWIIAALAAVAAVMLAGTQLSSIGALSTEEDPTRIRVAAGAASVAVLGTVIGIWLMSRVLTARLTTVRDIRLPEKPRTFWNFRTYRVSRKLKRLQRHIEGDPGFLEGRDSISALLADTADAQGKAVTAADHLRDARRDSGRDPDNESKKQMLTAAQADYDHAAHLRQVLVSRRSALLQLDGYLTVRTLFVVATSCLMVIAVAVAAALILFAWAANPPKPETDDAPSTAEPAMSLPRDGRPGDHVAGAALNSRPIDSPQPPVGRRMSTTVPHPGATAQGSDPVERSRP